MPKHIYLRGGLYWARFTFQGREYRFPLHTRNAAVAGKRARTERERMIGAMRFGERRVSFEEAFKAWAAHVERQVAASTLTRYAVSLNQIGGHLAGRFMDEIDNPLVSAIVAARRKAGVSNTTIRRDLTALSSVLGFAEDEGWRDDNPALRQRRRIAERRGPMLLPEDANIEAVAALCGGNFRRLVLAAWKTGARLGELVAARRTAFNAQAGQLTLIGKGGKLRVIDLSPEAHRILASAPAHIASPWLFWHSDGAPYRNLSSRFAGKVKTAQKTAQDFRPFRFHDLRHRYAVDYLKSGGAIYTLKGLMGHSSVKTTEIYLAHLTPAEAERAKHQIAG